MAVTRLIDRVKDNFAEVWDLRRAPDDAIEFDAALTTLPTVRTEYEDDDGNVVGHVQHQPAVLVFVSLACPEAGDNITSVCQVAVTMKQIQTPGGIEEAANDIWDQLTAARIGHSLGLLGEDEVEHPDGG